MITLGEECIHVSMTLGINVYEAIVSYGGVISNFHLVLIDDYRLT